MANEDKETAELPKKRSVLDKQNKVGPETTGPTRRRRQNRDSEVQDVASDKLFQQLIHQDTTRMDAELRNILLRGQHSMETLSKTKLKDIPFAEGRLRMIDRARTEAQICEVMKDVEEEVVEGKDEEETNKCFSKCCRRKYKPKPKIQEIQEILDKENEKRKMDTQQTLMRRLNRWIKWIVIGIAMFDFFLALQDIYMHLIYRMQTEYLFLKQIYNCDVLTGGGKTILIWTNAIHCVLSVSLLFASTKTTSRIILCWIVSQVFVIYVYLAEAFFRSRFSKRPLPTFLSFLYWRFPIDIIEIAIVTCRFYKLANPYKERLRRLSADPKLDRSLNTELRLKSSPFLQCKYRVREAAAFQTLEIIRKVNVGGDKAVGLGDEASRKKLIDEEIEKAIKLLWNPKHYPKKQTEAEAKTAPMKMDDDDGRTVLGKKSNRFRKTAKNVVRQTQDP